ncbi:MAG TPA: IS3 family transposase [Baekduia sp.]|nr:IS3 family transposase [Baekduia sp.]
MSKGTGYPREVRERAVRMVLEHRHEYANDWAAMTSIAGKLGMTPETVRKWVRQAEVDRGGARPGMSSEEAQRIKELERENRELRRANEILKSASIFLRAGARPATAQALSAYIDEHREVFGVEPICRVLGIAPSTYYAVKKRQAQPPARALRDAELWPQIERIYAASDGTYGAEKVWWQLQRDGVVAARCTVQRLMRKHEVQGVRRGKKHRTTIPGDGAQRPFDLVDRDFSAEAPNCLWVADFTYVMTWSGVAYVAFVIDVFSRRIVGWKADTTMKTSLVLGTLEMALWSRDRQGVPVAKGLIHHNDAGSRYTSFAFTSRLIKAGVDASVGSIGDGYDNAVAESTIGLFKTEKINRRGPGKTLADVEIATLEWVDWYNNDRLHAACDRRSPAEYENLYLSQVEAQ